MQETKDAMSIDAMQKTKTTMDDASECVLARACGSHAPRHMRTHDAKPVASEQSKNLAMPTDTPYHALIASLRAPPARSWQQMMRARLGIDKTKSWAPIFCLPVGFDRPRADGGQWRKNRSEPCGRTVATRFRLRRKTYARRIRG